MASIISTTSVNNRDLTSKKSFSYESSSTTSQGDKNSFGNLSLKENDDSLQLQQTKLPMGSLDTKIKNLETKTRARKSLHNFGLKTQIQTNSVASEGSLLEQRIYANHLLGKKVNTQNVYVMKNINGKIVKTIRKVGDQHQKNIDFDQKQQMTKKITERN